MKHFLIISLSLFISFNLHGKVEAKMALVQYDADKHFGDYDLNKDALTRFADQAVAGGAKIIVFPEGSHYGYADAKTKVRWCLSTNTSAKCRNINEAAEAIPGDRTTDYWIDYAKARNVYILFNTPEKDGDKFYNTTGVVGPEGFVGKYRKRLLYTTDEYYASAGKNSFILKTPYGNFGLIICMDINGDFIEKYKTQGVDAIILQSDWDEPVPEALYDYSGEAVKRKTDIYASDVSSWDGTGKYSFKLGNGKRERPGLPVNAENVDGFSIHQLNY